MNTNKKRYERQVLLNWIGKKGQDILFRKKVLVIGAGTLGSSILNLLARSGVGFLRIVDRDIVEYQDLCRQTLYDTEDALNGLPKVVAAREKLKKINDGVLIEEVFEDFDYHNAESISKEMDLIIDATDNFETRFLINEISYKLKIPWVHGACVMEKGEVSFFIPDKTPCYQCLFPKIPPVQGETCDTRGLSASIPEIIASMQVDFALKILLNPRVLPLNTFFYIDLYKYNFLKLKFEKRKDCPVCEKKNYEFLEGKKGISFHTLCGRDTVQVKLYQEIDLSSIQKKFSRVEKKPYYLKIKKDSFELLVFKNKRVFVRKENITLSFAKKILSKYLGI